MPDLNAKVEKMNAAHKDMIGDFIDSKLLETPSETNFDVDNGTMENHLIDEGSDLHVNVKSFKFSDMVQTFAKTEMMQNRQGKNFTYSSSAFC